jgi:hypothetical protein
MTHEALISHTSNWSQLPTFPFPLPLRFFVHRDAKHAHTLTHALHSTAALELEAFSMDGEAEHTTGSCSARSSVALLFLLRTLVITAGSCVVTVDG